MAKHNETGKIGEDVAAQWCSDRNLVVIQRNYRKNFGEIDIVARETTGKVHFIEVKTVSYETKQQLKDAVSYGTWRPEENVDGRKQFKFKRMINTWIEEHAFSGAWQIDILAVRIVPREKYATVKCIENVVFE